jgi:hypothetical protein
MANNYCQWSEYFPINSKAESDWLKSVLSVDISRYENADELSKSQLIQKILGEFFGVEISVDDADFFPGFSKEFNDDNSGVYVYAEDFGNIEVAATIFQAFLKKFRPDDYFKIQWANTCSKPRAGEFGGGAVFITASNIVWHSTGSWVSNQISSFKG